MKTIDINVESIKNFKKKNREEEIKTHRKQIIYRTLIAGDKTKYNRKIKHKHCSLKEK